MLHLPTYLQCAWYSFFSDFTYSSSATSSATTTCESNVEKDVRVLAKRRPGRPRKFNPTKNSLVLSKSWLTQRLHSNSEIGDDHFTSADLSPPILKPMCSWTLTKLGRNDVLSPPTLLPRKQAGQNEESQRSALGTVIYDSEVSELFSTKKKW